jgi:two-component system, NarL family, nitrate/nitrite response regulator NarL
VLSYLLKPVLRAKTHAHHFLLPDSGITWPLPPERWAQAFPEGRSRDWPSLQQTVLAGDMVWVPVSGQDWPQRVDALLQLQAGCRIVVLSAVPSEAEGLRALDAGARGYCHLLAVSTLLREVAQVVGLGGLWVGPELVQRLVAATRGLLPQGLAQKPQAIDLSLLSEREAQVACAVARGHTNREVAEQLHISERTVKAHLGAVFEKLGVRDRVQLVLQLAQAG